MSHRVQRTVLGFFCLFMHAQVSQKSPADRVIFRHCKGDTWGLIISLRKDGMF